LNCRVQVVSQQIQGTNKKIFETLQNAIFEFLNNKKWTSTVFGSDERIECNILINLTEQVSADQFRGTMQIQSTRPVFNSNYNSTLFNYKDADLDFRYIEFQTLDFNESSFSSNLTSVLAYWAYVIIGLDFDSFSLEGGTECFQKAEKIVNNASNASEKGWKAFDSNLHKNRYWLIEDIMDDKYRSVREFIYRYNRLGMDVMAEKPTDGRSEIAEDFKLLQKVYRDKPSPFMPYYQSVFDAKADEFVNVFSESFPDEKSRVSTILIEIDPSNTSKYQKINNKE
jgi:hypothetical protein